MMSDEARSFAGAQFYFRSDCIVFARGASALALLLHEAVESLDIDLDSLIAQHVLRQIEWKTVSVVEPKGDLAG